MRFRRFPQKFIFFHREKKPTALDLFRQELVKINEKSQDSFEIQLSYIAAGGIAITVAFISDIIKLEQAGNKIFLFIGWLLLTSTLLINWYSHRVSFNNHLKTIEDIDFRRYKRDVVVKRNRAIRMWNKWSMWTLISGIISILLFIVINMLLMAKEVKVIPPNPDTGKKGRESVTPPPPIRIPDQHPQPSPNPLPQTGRETNNPPEE